MPLINYNEIQNGLGKKFFLQINKHFNSIKRNPKAFAIRYDKIRCLYLKKFPYMIHYKVFDELKIVTVKAVFSTHQNPSKWEIRI